MTLPSASDEPTQKFQQKMKDLQLERDETRAKQQALVLSMPYVFLKGLAIPIEMLTVVPEEVARQLLVIPFDQREGDVLIGTVNPPTEAHASLVATIKREHFRGVKWYLMSQHSFDRSIVIYASVPKFTEAPKGVEIRPEDLLQWQNQRSLKDISTSLSNIPITKMFNLIIAGALNTRSSDVHIEADENNVHLRYRIDGVLMDIATLPRDVWKQLASRLKLLAKLKLNITDKPQDGRFRISMPESAQDMVDVRVSTLPTNFGESIVIRLLGSSLVGDITFDSLGLVGESLGLLKAQVERPNGMVITTGPTGSGKTTTMYTILRMLNEPGVKIITIEDPIEYELKGITQSQIDADKNYTFANGLKSIVRQDPDIILVGEIRDTETTEIAIQAALTGHMVLSTVHTNSAAGTIPRLIALGAKPFLLAPALNAMIGQRLVRKLCDNCKQPATIPAEVMERAHTLLGTLPEHAKKFVNMDTLAFMAPKGCNLCNDIGYKGRIGVFEILVMTKDLEQIIHGGSASEIEIQDMAVKNGMVTMVQDGLIKAAQGLTSVEEVFRVAE